MIMMIMVMMVTLGLAAAAVEDILWEIDQRVGPGSAVTVLSNFTLEQRLGFWRCCHFCWFSLLCPADTHIKVEPGVSRMVDSSADARWPGER